MNRVHRAMGVMKIRFSLFLYSVGAGLLPTASFADAAYVDWISASPGDPGWALGTIGALSISYTCEVSFAQVDGDFNYWAFSSPPPYDDPSYDAYTGVPNMPTNSDLIALIGGTPTVNKLTFSQPVVDPVMLIVSL